MEKIDEKKAMFQMSDVLINNETLVCKRGEEDSWECCSLTTLVSLHLIFLKEKTHRKFLHRGSKGSVGSSEIK